MGIYFSRAWVISLSHLGQYLFRQPSLLKLGSIAGPSSLEGQGAALFGKLIEQKTKGEVKVNVGYSSAFGGLGPLLQSVEMGSVDMMVSSIDQWEFIDPALRILRFAYVFRDYDHYTKYLNSPDCRGVFEKTYRAESANPSTPKEYLLDQRPLSCFSQQETCLYCRGCQGS